MQKKAVSTKAEFVFGIITEEEKKGNLYQRIATRLHEQEISSEEFEAIVKKELSMSSLYSCNICGHLNLIEKGISIKTGTPVNYR